MMILCLCNNTLSLYDDILSLYDDTLSLYDGTLLIWWFFVYVMILCHYMMMLCYNMMIVCHYTIILCHYMMMGILFMLRLRRNWKEHNFLFIKNPYHCITTNYNRMWPCKTIIRILSRLVFGQFEPGIATKFPRCIISYFLIISDRKKCFQQKFNPQIFNAIIWLITY